MGWEYVQRTVANSASRHSNNHAPEVPSRHSFAVAELACFVDYLIEGRKDIIGELNLDYGFHALGSSANCSSNYSLLGERCVEHPLVAKLLLQTRSAPEHAAKGHILAETEYAIRCCQCRL